MNIPKLGEDLYFPATDDCTAGMGTVNRIRDEYGYLMVGCEENPYTMWNWNHLKSLQRVIKRRVKQLQ